MQQALTPNDRIVDARRQARTASQLTWNSRVLLAAAEAAYACVPTVVRAEVACAITDKAAHDLATARTAGAVQRAVADALVAAGLSTFVSGPALTRVAWRLLFDLNGGPG